MFGQVLSTSRELEYSYTLLTEPGEWVYFNTQQEEAYLREIYPITVIDDIESYKNSWYDNGGYVKCADLYDTCQYQGLVHEVYLTLKLQSKEVLLQKVIDVAFTDTELFVVFERIDHGTLNEVIHKDNPQRLFNILTSLFQQLKYLYDTYQFTHYDLHVNNIMINSKGQPVIIDLQYSHAHIDGCGYGLMMLSDEDDATLILPSYYWPFDIYKLLMFIRMTCGGNVENYIDTLLMYFIDANQLSHIRHASIFNSPPRIDLISNYITPFDEFVSYFHNIISVV